MIWAQMRQIVFPPQLPDGLFQAAKRRLRGVTRTSTSRRAIFPFLGKLDSSALLGALLATAALLNAPVVVAEQRQNLQEARTAPQVPESQRVLDFSNQTLAKILPGRTTKAEVEALLGKPWRDTELDAEDISYPGDPSVDVWEYRGRDSGGTYRVHIEFDKYGVTTLIAKIPDKTGRGIARVEKDAPTPGKRDQNK